MWKSAKKYIHLFPVNNDVKTKRREQEEKKNHRGRNKNSEIFALKIDLQQTKVWKRRSPAYILSALCVFQLVCILFVVFLHAPQKRTYVWRTCFYVHLRFGVFVVWSGMIDWIWCGPFPPMRHCVTFESLPLQHAHTQTHLCFIYVFVLCSCVFWYYYYIIYICSFCWSDHTPPPFATWKISLHIHIRILVHTHTAICISSPFFVCCCPFFFFAWSRLISLFHYIHTTLMNEQNTKNTHIPSTTLYIFMSHYICIISVLFLLLLTYLYIYI